MIVPVLKALTDFGDAALLLPMSLLLAIVLAYRHSLKAGGLWLMTLALCLTGMAMLKVMGFACGRELFGSSVVSPSGHAAFSATFYGALAVIAHRQFAGWRRIGIPLALCGVVVAVVMTRVLLGNHSKAEALLGLAMGSVSVALFAWRFRSLAQVPLRLRAEAFAFVLLLVLLHGERLHAERFLKHIALQVRERADVCLPPAKAGEMTRFASWTA